MPAVKYSMLFLIKNWFLLLSSLFQSSHLCFHSAYLVKFESVDLGHAWEECYNFLVGHEGWGGDEGGFYLTRSMLFNFVSKMEMSC